MCALISDENTSPQGLRNSSEVFCFKRKVLEKLFYHLSEPLLDHFEYVTFKHWPPIPQYMYNSVCPHLRWKHKASMTDKLFRRVSFETSASENMFPHQLDKYWRLSCKITSNIHIGLRSFYIPLFVCTLMSDENMKPTQLTNSSEVFDAASSGSENMLLHQSYPSPSNWKTASLLTE